MKTHESGASHNRPRPSYADGGTVGVGFRWRNWCFSEVCPAAGGAAPRTRDRDQAPWPPPPDWLWHRAGGRRTGDGCLAVSLRTKHDVNRYFAGNLI